MLNGGFIHPGKRTDSNTMVSYVATDEWSSGNITATNIIGPLVFKTYDNGDAYEKMIIKGEDLNFRRNLKQQLTIPF